MFSTTLQARLIDDRIRSYRRSAETRRALKDAFRGSSVERRREALRRRLRLETA